jgi:hypothetical protein
MDTYQIGLIVAAGVILFLYLRRRRSRLNRED